MIRIKLGTYQPVDPAEDPLGRSFVGYWPRMSEDEAIEAGRGCWRLGARADQERFALITGGGQVLAAMSIERVVSTSEPDRRALVGARLNPGHPVYDAYVGKPDPVEATSRNPIAYAHLPVEDEFLTRRCACGCGEETTRDFAPGHDQRAIHERIRRHFGGRVVDFLAWIDEHGPEAA